MNSQPEATAMSGYQLSGDAPAAYARFAGKVMGTWTDDLIVATQCQDGDRVLDVACKTGLVARHVNAVSRQLCAVTGIDHNEGMLNVARSDPQVAWHPGSAIKLPFETGSFAMWYCASRSCSISQIDGRCRISSAAGEPLFDCVESGLRSGEENTLRHHAILMIAWALLLSATVIGKNRT